MRINSWHISQALKNVHTLLCSFMHILRNTSCWIKRKELQHINTVLLFQSSVMVSQGPLPFWKLLRMIWSSWDTHCLNVTQSFTTGEAKLLGRQILCRRVGCVFLYSWKQIERGKEHFFLWTHVAPLAGSSLQLHCWPAVTAAFNSQMSCNGTQLWGRPGFSFGK